MKRGLEKDKCIQRETHFDKKGNKITICWPDISEEENQRRIEAFKKATVKFVLAADRARAEVKREEAKRHEKERT